MRRFLLALTIAAMPAAGSPFPDADTCAARGGVRVWIRDEQLTRGAAEVVCVPGEPGGDPPADAIFRDEFEA